MGWGYAIPIPNDADEEARMYVNGELTKLYWNFHMTNIGRQWYVVLFPL